ncbi:beta-hydroxyacid dehydrogenase [Rhodococcoides trifolii]|uniref:Beta-hydroxyacid dehydrogenase n=1 Tax=Rhodococcoides trifolii TaxID=908250 RepID=A0A917FTB1_9NOCA|nr:NAD(P)-dependent oxidoreductase [Rhodococcus trifolii]GGG03206.1 beta-hydroxyacid dehydrogenase [Rhodococcus trifolii]
MHSPTVDVLFIGIGAIGLPMASRIKQAGHRVTAVDRSQDRRRDADRAGLGTAEAPTAADVAVVMVASGAQLASVVEDDGGLLQVLPRGSVCIVMSTVGPDAVRSIADKFAAHGVDVVDAPVTGGVERAEAGELTIFAAGNAYAVHRVGDVLQAMGTIHPCGHEPGRGQSLKLVNQLLCSIHLVAAAEALAFAEALELDPEDVHRAVSSGAGASFMLSDRGPRMLAASGSEVPFTALDIFAKDSALVHAAAAQVGFDAPLLGVAAQAFSQASDLGLGRADDSRIREIYKTKVDGRG